MNKDFVIVDHTADIGIQAFGTDLHQTFANAGKGMFSLITDLDKIEEVIHRDVSVTASDLEALLVEWLNELIFLFDTEMLLFRRFHIESITDTEIKARCYGEKVDRSRHNLKIGIKSATYHMLEVAKENGNGYRARVLFDV